MPHRLFEIHFRFFAQKHSRKCSTTVRVPALGCPLATLSDSILACYKTSLYFDVTSLYLIHSGFRTLKVQGPRGSYFFFQLHFVAFPENTSTLEEV